LRKPLVAKGSYLISYTDIDITMNDLSELLQPPETDASAAA